MTKTERLNEMEYQVKEIQKNIDALKNEIENEKLVFSLERFKNQDFVVNCKTETDSNIFLAYLQGNGYSWGVNGKLLSQKYWDNYKNKTCYRASMNERKILNYADRDYYTRTEKMEIIEFTIEMLND